MLSYSNAFSCTTNSNNNEFIFSFNQNCPVIDDAGAVTGSTSELVARIVLTRDGAEALRQILDTALAKSAPAEEIHG